MEASVTSLSKSQGQEWVYTGAGELFVCFPGLFGQPVLSLHSDLLMSALFV